MALIDIKEVAQNSLLGIWEIDELNVNGYHQNTGQTLSNVKTSLKGKKERLATGLLLNQMHPGSSINYFPTGKPYLVNDEMHISISHSGNFVAILLNRNSSVGVDIQKPHINISNLKTKFLSEKEINDVSNKNEIDALHIYWGAKESLYKYWGRGGLEYKSSLEIEPFLLKNEGVVTGWIKKDDFKEKLNLHYEKLGDYFLIYTIK